MSHLRPTVAISICFGLGIFIGAQTPYDIEYTFWACLLCLVAVVFIKASKLLLICFLLLGILRFQLSVDDQSTQETTSNSWSVDKVTLYPKGQKLMVSQSELKRVVYVRDTLNMLYPKDSIRFSSTLNWKPLQFIESPHAFSYTDYLREEGVDSVAFVYKNQYRVPYKHSSLKNRILHQIDHYPFSIYSKQLIGNLTLASKRWNGEQQELIQALRSTGLIHVLAISGLHIGLLFFMIQSALKVCFRRQSYTHRLGIIALLPIWLFVGFVGFPISAVRAALMCSVYALGRCNRSPQNGFHVLFLTALILLTIRPQDLFNMGFLLSMSAVLSIFMFYGFIFKGLQPYFPKQFTKLVQGISVTLSAQLGVLPFMIFVFGHFPLGFLVANLTVLWLIPVLLIVSLSLLITSFYLDMGWLLHIFDQAIEQLINYLNLLQRWLPIVDFGRWNTWSQCCVVLLILCLAVWGRSDKLRSKIRWAMLVLLLCLFTVEYLEQRQISQSQETIWLAHKHELFCIQRSAHKLYIQASTSDSLAIDTMLHHRLNRWILSNRIDEVGVVSAPISWWFYIDQQNDYHIYTKDTVFRLHPYEYKRVDTVQM